MKTRLTAAFFFLFLMLSRPLNLAAVPQFESSVRLEVQYFVWPILQVNGKLLRLKRTSALWVGSHVWRPFLKVARKLKAGSDLYVSSVIFFQRPLGAIA